MSDCHFGVSPVNYPDPESVEKVQWKLLEELVSHTMQYQTIIFSEHLSKLAMLKTLSVCQQIIFQHQTSSCTSSICL